MLIAKTGLKPLTIPLRTSPPSPIGSLARTRTSGRGEPPPHGRSGTAAFSDLPDAFGAPILVVPMLREQSWNALKPLAPKSCLTKLFLQAGQNAA
jgi:hypothetical protein